MMTLSNLCWYVKKEFKVDVDATGAKIEFELCFKIFHNLLFKQVRKDYLGFGSWRTRQSRKPLKQRYIFILISEEFFKEMNFGIYFPKCFVSISVIIWTVLSMLFYFIFVIDQQEDSLLSSSDESSIFILGSKNSVSF